MSWIWIEKLRSYYSGFSPGRLSFPNPTESPKNTLVPILSLAIHNLQELKPLSCHCCTFNPATFAITSWTTIKKNGVRDGTKAGSKLKVITKAFLRTLPLRISPSSQEAFSSSVNPLMSGPPLRLSTRWLRCRLHTLLSKNTQRGLYFLTQSASRTHLKLKGHKVFLFQRWLKANIFRNKCHKSSHHVAVKNHDTMLTNISLYTVSNGAGLSNTRQKDLENKWVRLQLLILIEKCTHVKGRKNVLLRKIKWRKRCLNGISVLLRNSMYIQNWWG